MKNLRIPLAVALAAICLLLFGGARSGAAPIAPSAYTTASPTDYALTSLTISGVVYDNLIGSTATVVSTSVTLDYFLNGTTPVLGTNSASSAVSGLSYREGAANIADGSLFQFGQVIGDGDRIFISDYGAGDPITLNLIDGSGAVVGDYHLALLAANFGLLIPANSYTFVNDINGSTTSLPANTQRFVSFKLGDFTGTTGNLSTATGIKLATGGNAWDPSMVGLAKSQVTQVAPIIVYQPKDQAVAIGGDATFQVVADGTAPLFYKWYSNSVPPLLLQEGVDLASLVISNASQSISGSSYFVVVTNLLGAATSAPPATLTVVNVSSPTVGYWRFEDVGNLGVDSSGNGLVLTNGSGFSSISSYALPSTNVGGNGAYFSKTIPLTGVANMAAIAPDGLSYLTFMDWPSFTLSNQLTIEAFFNINEGYAPVFNPIASKWANSANQQEWLFGVKELNPGAGDLRLRFAINTSGGGNWSQSVDQWPLEPGKDYYAAVTVSNGIVTFYLADLSAPDPKALIQSYAATGTNFVKSTTAFSIGAWDAGNVTFKGVIDEVRMSRVALPKSQLLYTNVSEAPYITQQPQSLTVLEQANATFNVAAMGHAPLSYQWYNASGPTLILGATNTSLTVSNLSLGQSGSSYYVIVANSFGSITSVTSVVTVVSSTVGYWRFENSGDLGLDSSSGGLQLTNAGTPVGFSLPSASSGLPGGLFPKTIPSTGQVNVNALQLSGNSYLGSGPSSTLFVGSKLTVEAFFNAAAVDSTGASTPIASQWNLNTQDKSWLFSAAGFSTNFNLRLAVGNGANVAVFNTTDLVLVTNRDYYAAAVFDSGAVTLYVADMSLPNPVLQARTFTTTITNIINGGAGLRVGSYQQTNVFLGVLDEVRVSRKALSPQTLLLNNATPLYPPSNLTGLVFASGNAQIFGTGVGGVGYSLLRATNVNLPLAAWEVVATNVIATPTNGSLQYLDTNPPAPSSFYRFRQP